MKNIKLLLIVMLMFIGIILISGCQDQLVKKLDDNSNIIEIDDNRFLLNRLIISFNGKEQNSLIANSNNEKFRDYFYLEINNLIKEITNIVDINISWSPDFSVLMIDYKEGTTKLEKKGSLDQLINSLEFRWYTKNIVYDRIGQIT